VNNPTDSFVGGYQFVSEDLRFRPECHHIDNMRPPPIRSPVFSHVPRSVPFLPSTVVNSSLGSRILSPVRVSRNPITGPVSFSVKKYSYPQESVMGISKYPDTTATTTDSGTYSEVEYSERWISHPCLDKPVRAKHIIPKRRAMAYGWGREYDTPSSPVRIRHLGYRSPVSQYDTATSYTETGGEYPIVATAPSNTIQFIDPGITSSSIPVMQRPIMQSVRVNGPPRHNQYTSTEYYQEANNRNVAHTMRVDNDNQIRPICRSLPGMRVTHYNPMHMEEKRCDCVESISDGPDVEMCQCGDITDRHAHDGQLISCDAGRVRLDLFIRCVPRCQSRCSFSYSSCDKASNDTKRNHPPCACNCHPVNSRTSRQSSINKIPIENYSGDSTRITDHPSLQHPSDNEDCIEREQDDDDNCDSTVDVQLSATAEGLELLQSPSSEEMTREDGLDDEELDANSVNYNPLESIREEELSREECTNRSDEKSFSSSQVGGDEPRRLLAEIDSFFTDGGGSYLGDDGGTRAQSDLLSMGFYRSSSSLDKDENQPLSTRHRRSSERSCFTHPVSMEEEKSTTSSSTSSHDRPPTLKPPCHDRSDSSDGGLVQSREMVISTDDEDGYLVASSEYSEDQLGELQEIFHKDENATPSNRTQPRRVDTPVPWKLNGGQVVHVFENFTPVIKNSANNGSGEASANKFMETKNTSSSFRYLLDTLDSCLAPISNDAFSDNIIFPSDDLPTTYRFQSIDQTSSQAELIMLSPMASCRDDPTNSSLVNLNPLVILRQGVPQAYSSIASNKNSDICRKDSSSDTLSSQRDTITHNGHPPEIEDHTTKMVVAFDSGVTIDTNMSGGLNLIIKAEMVNNSISDLDSSIDLPEGPFTYKGQSYRVNARIPLAMRDNNYVLEDIPGVYPEGSEGEITLTHHQTDKDDSSYSVPGSARLTNRIGSDKVVPVSDAAGRWYDVSSLFENGMKLLSRARNVANPCAFIGRSFEDDDDDNSSNVITNLHRDDGASSVGSSEDSCGKMKVNQIREKETTSGSKGFWSTYSYQTSFGTTSNDDSWPLILPAPVGDGID